MAVFRKKYISLDESLVRSPFMRILSATEL